MAGWTIALSVSSCSLVLDWSGYTGGEARGSDGDAADDAIAAGGAKDAVDDHDVAGELDAPNDRDVSQGGGLDAAPACSPKNCGGCCNADGFCAGGGSTATCGTGGKACIDCASMGQRCDQGVCSAVDSGAAPMCTDTQCRSMLTLCIPAYQISCCLPDGTCGCQKQIPSLGMCM
jgi:hypothetical protein